jgi:hypothetical protein
MHTRTFDLGDNKHVTVAFNPDFSGMAVVRWGDVMTGQSVEIPAIVLTVGVADLADGLWELAEQAQAFRVVGLTHLYTEEEWKQEQAARDAYLREVEMQP